MPTNFKGTPQHGGTISQVWGKRSAADDDATWIDVGGGGGGHVGDMIRVGSPTSNFDSGADVFVDWNDPPSRVVGTTFSRNPADHTQIVCAIDALVSIQGFVYWEDSGHAAGTRYMELLVGVNPPGDWHDIIEESIGGTEGTIQNVLLVSPMAAGDSVTLDIIQSSGVTLDLVLPVIQCFVIAEL